MLPHTRTAHGVMTVVQIPESKVAEKGAAAHLIEEKLVGAQGRTAGHPGIGGKSWAT